MKAKLDYPTPGPLVICRSNADPLACGYTVERVENGLRSVVARMHDSWLCDEHSGTALGNARLFAKAPLLVEARDILAILVEQGYYPHLSTLDAARALLAKLEAE